MLHVFTRATRPIRAVAKAAIFFLKVFPMLPSRPIDWVTKPPVIEKVRYPTRFGQAEGDVYRPSAGGLHPGIVVCLDVVLPKRIHARLTATNANRWVTRPYHIIKEIYAKNK